MVQITNEHREYLSNLETWGVTNIDAAAPYLKNEFPGLTLLEARAIIGQWLSTKNQLLNETVR